MTVTIFKTLYDKEPHYITVDQALDRIKTGKSAATVAEVRGAIDKHKADSLKRNLPAVVFSGKLSARGDKNLIEPSGFIILDFDKLEDLTGKIDQLKAFQSTYAAWQSPTGTGVKALVRIADGMQLRNHFLALQEVFPDVDASGKNEERLCFESYDEEIYINRDAKPFTTVIQEQRVTVKEEISKNEKERFDALLKWMANRNDAFVSGNRNAFIFRLAGGCCRFGIEMHEAGNLIASEFATSTDFDTRELLRAIKSAYRTNQSAFGTVRFEQDRLVNIKSRKDVKLEDIPDFDPDAPSKDVIYAAEVKGEALEILRNGYASISGINVPEIDERWKAKKGELTLLSGVGNYGKSAFYKWYMLMRVLVHGERFASFAPEDNPAAEYYHDFVEMLLGCECTPSNPNCPSEELYSAAYDWIGQHIFYLYPKEEAATPEYILKRFLEVIVKDKVNGVCIDPFNQLSLQWSARSDKTLEVILGEWARFAQVNQVYFIVIAHPKALAKQADKNYPCPDVFDINDGAMWNNKVDNMLIYHRPFGQTEPNSPVCELHSKKIRRKTVGRKGFTEFRYIVSLRRFQTGSDDPMETALQARGISFAPGRPAPVIPIQSQSPIDIPDDFWND